MRVRQSGGNVALIKMFKITAMLRRNPDNPSSFATSCGSISIAASLLPDG